MKKRLFDFAVWLVSPLMLRRYLLAVVALVTLVVLFYVEEDWRGARAWAALKAKLEAQGETLDPQSFIPPPVPDDENFCMTPLLAGLYEHQDQPGVVLSQSKSAQTIEDMGWEDKSADKKKKPESFGNWQDGEKCDLEVLRDYYLSDPAFAAKHSGESTTQIIAAHFDEHAAEWKELENASLRKYGRFPVNYAPVSVVDIPRPHLEAVMTLGKALQVKILNELEAGQNQQSLADMHILFKLQNAMKHEPLLIPDIMRMSTVDHCLGVIWQGSERHRFTTADLDAMEEELRKLDFLKDFHWLMREENCFNFGREEDYLKEKYLWERHAYFAKISSTGATFPTWQFWLESYIWQVAPAGWFDLNKTCATELIYKYLLPTVDPAAHRVYPDKAKKYEKYLHDWVSSYDPINYYAKSSVADFSRMECVWSARPQAWVDMGIISCELEKYYLQKRRYPASLDELGKQLPHDVTSGEPYHYQLTPDDRYKLWSNGWYENDKWVWRYSPEPASQ